MGAGRKQAARRQARRVRDAEKKSAWARNEPIAVAVGVLIFLAFFAVIDAFFLHTQIEIARVMTTGLPARATVTAVNCSGGRSATEHVTVTFTDDHGNSRTVAHTADTIGCFNDYHAGDVITIRYAPSDPTTLMTQAEIDEVPFTLVVYGLIDLLFVIGPPVLLVWMLWDMDVPWVRRRHRAARVETAASLPDASSTDSPATGDAS